MDASIRIDGGMETLPALMQFAEQTAATFRLPDDVAYAFQLSIEEICTNLIKYGYGDTGHRPVSIHTNRAAGQLTIKIRDRSTPFDPRTAPAPDLSVPLSERAPGGLGLYLVNSIMDSVDYHSDATGWNTLVMVKRWDER